METQRLILMALYDFGSWAGVGTAQAAEKLGKPKFTAMRVFDQLAAIDPGLIKAEGKVRWLALGTDRKSFLQKVAPHLLMPVKLMLARFPHFLFHLHTHIHKCICIPDCYT